MYAEAYLEPSRTSMVELHGGTSMQKSQNSFIVDARVGSKYVSGIGFTVEKV